MPLGVKTTHQVNVCVRGNFHNFVFVLNVLWVRKFIPATTNGVTLKFVTLKFKVT